MSQAKRCVICSLLVLSGMSAVAGCSGGGAADKVEQRRVLLRPPDSKRELEEQQRKLQVFDESGNLIPSEESVAGLLLPRGLSPGRQFEHEWYFTGLHVPAPALERYFAPRLQTNDITRSGDGAVLQFTGATIKADPKALGVTVRIVKMRGENDASELYIRQSLPPVTFHPSQAEVEAEMAKRRAHAE
jgi:hypothetical protein